MSFSFGSSATTKPGFTFGSSTSTTTAKVQPFNFGNTATSKSGTTSGFGFGATATQAAKTTASLFGTTTTTSASTGFSGFGTGGFKLGGTTTTATTASGFTLGGSLAGGAGASSSTTASLGFGSTLTAATAAPEFKGLGGVSSTTNASNQNDNGNKNNGVSQALKEQNVPDELCKDVKAFEEFVKKQKEGSGAVGKFSVAPLRKIQEEVVTLSYALGTVSSALHRNNAAVQKLREDFTEELRNQEMARHTQDIPPSLQHDNFAPIKFFINMAIEFESSMQVYRRQIEELENHLNLTEHSSSLSPQDIYVALCKMQESFISLAANLHSIHDQVKNLKENYLIYRRIVHNDPVDVFAEHRKKATQGQKFTKSTGPSPFNQLSNVAALAMATMANQRTQQQGPPQQGFLSTQPTGSGGLFGGGTKPTGTAGLFGSSTSTGTKFGGFGGFGQTQKPLSAGFGTSATSSSGLFGNNASFNTSAGLTFGGTAAGSTFELKRPPPGNKRNKK